MSAAAESPQPALVVAAESRPGARLQLVHGSPEGTKAASVDALIEPPQKVACSCRVGKPVAAQHPQNRTIMLQPGQVLQARAPDDQAKYLSEQMVGLLVLSLIHI